MGIAVGQKYTAEGEVARRSHMHSPAKDVRIWQSAGASFTSRVSIASTQGPNYGDINKFYNPAPLLVVIRRRRRQIDNVGRRNSVKCRTVSIFFAQVDHLRSHFLNVGSHFLNVGKLSQTQKVAIGLCYSSANCCLSCLGKLSCIQT